MSETPIDIRADKQRRILSIIWKDRSAEFPLVFLRGQCACAQCVNEWTGERILDLNAIPDDIGILQMELVGNYAIRIHWSDGHNSGLFTWQRLVELQGSC